MLYFVMLTLATLYALTLDFIASCPTDTGHLLSQPPKTGLATRLNTPLTIASKVGGVAHSTHALQQKKKESMKKKKHNPVSKSKKSLSLKAIGNNGPTVGQSSGIFPVAISTVVKQKRVKR